MLILFRDMPLYYELSLAWWYNQFACAVDLL